MWETIIIGTLLIEVLIFIYILIRQEWILIQQEKLFNRNPIQFGRLSSYNKILLGHGFWIWDINYFLDK